MSTANDVTPNGTRIEGAFENDRNAESAELFKAIIRKVFGVTDVIVGHHLVYVATERDENGYTIQVVEEIPSADALIFDHDVARKLWPEDWVQNLAWLAMTSQDQRDAVLANLCKGVL
jgi:hypothetical protein